MTETEPRQLTRVRVENLLGRFTHDIPFDPEWNFVIIYGPNGIGKTRLFELVNATLTGTYSDIAAIPFGKASFLFSDGTVVEVARPAELRLNLEAGTHPDPTVFESGDSLLWTISLEGGSPQTYPLSRLPPHEDPHLVQRIEHRYPVEQLDVDLWIDGSTGEEMDFYEMVRRFNIPMKSDFWTGKTPELEAFHKEQTSHLIETQRLMSSHRLPRRRGPRSWRRKRSQPTVISYAEHLVSRLDTTLAANSRMSQELDRTFPNRLFRKDIVNLSLHDKERLRERYLDQLRLRVRLANIAILDRSPLLDLTDQQLSGWAWTVLSTYLDDVDKKLETFQPLLDRLELLRELINRKFLFKRLDFDRTDGFIVRDVDSERLLDLSQLSSGEQHELVLMYGLLMKVPPRSLVLIDEPEISLHVSWQNSLLDDLDRIGSITKLRFMIATHSPQIINNWWDRAVPLTAE